MRRDLIKEVGGDLSLPVLITRILGSEEAWTAFSSCSGRRRRSESAATRRRLSSTTTGKEIQTGRERRTHLHPPLLLGPEGHEMWREGASHLRMGIVIGGRNDSRCISSPM